MGEFSELSLVIKVKRLFWVVLEKRKKLLELGMISSTEKFKNDCLEGCQHRPSLSHTIEAHIPISMIHRAAGINNNVHIVAHPNQIKARLPHADVGLHAI